MKAYELFQNLKPSIVQDIFMWFRDEDRNLYKNTLNTLATNKKLRLAFLQKKPVPEQIEWMHNCLKQPASDLVSEHLLQIYFMKGQQDMLVVFCDTMGISHDGNGQVEEDLPESLDSEKLKAAADALLEKFDPAMVTLYFHVFNIQTENGWENLSNLLENDERLKLN